MDEFKEDIKKLLASFFGQQVEDMIEEYYNDPKELLKLTNEMLTKLLGEKNAKDRLNSIIKKYHINKVKK
jgi:hypothetical protein